MSEQVLFRIAGFPAPMMVILTSGNFAELARNKIMLSTKCFYAMNKVFSTIGRSSNECFHLVPFGLLRFGTRFRSMFLAKMGSLSTRACFRRVYTPKAIGIADVASMQFGITFRRKFFPKTVSIAKTSKSQLLAGLSSMFGSKARTGHAVNVQTLLPKGFELIKPVLLASSQKLRDKHQFDHFKGKRLLSMFIPSMLKFGIMVNIAAKFTAMFNPTPVQVDGTTNVDFASNGASDEVNSRYGGDGIVVKWIHSYHPSNQGGSLGSIRVTSAFGAASFAPIISHPYQMFHITCQKAQVSSWK